MNPCPHFLESFPQLGHCTAKRPARLGKGRGKAKLCPAPPSKSAPKVSDIATDPAPCMSSQSHPMDLPALDEATVIRRPAKLPSIPQRDWSTHCCRSLGFGCVPGWRWGASGGLYRLRRLSRPCACQYHWYLRGAEWMMLWPWHELPMRHKRKSYPAYPWRVYLQVQHRAW